MFTSKIFHLPNLREAFTPGGSKMRYRAYLPGTGDTLINKGVLPGRGLSIALRWADPCDRLKCRWLGCVISWWGGLRSRYPLHNQFNGRDTKHLSLDRFSDHPVRTFGLVMLNVQETDSNAHVISCPVYNVFIFECPHSGGGDSSVVRAPNSWLKGRGFESLLERRENFLLQGRLSVLTLISVSVPPPCYHSST